eukprot:821710-Pyramimonas_sp.AAC.1
MYWGRFISNFHNWREGQDQTSLWIRCPHVLRFCALRPRVPLFLGVTRGTFDESAHALDP